MAIQISNSREIILNLVQKQASKKAFDSPQFVQLVNDLMGKYGITLKNHKKWASQIVFRDLDAFTTFHNLMLPKFPFEITPNDQNFILQVSYEKIPSQYTFEQLHKISIQPYIDMKIPVTVIKPKQIYQITFPSLEAYFATIVQVLAICDGENPLEVS
jgi:hypothetical protein